MANSPHTCVICWSSTKGLRYCGPCKSTYICRACRAGLSTSVTAGRRDECPNCRRSPLAKEPLDCAEIDELPANAIQPPPKVEYIRYGDGEKVPRREYLCIRVGVGNGELGRGDLKNTEVYFSNGPSAESGRKKLYAVWVPVAGERRGKVLGPPKGMDGLELPKNADRIIWDPAFRTPDGKRRNFRIQKQLNESKERVRARV